MYNCSRCELNGNDRRAVQNQKWTITTWCPGCSSNTVHYYVEG